LLDAFENATRQKHDGRITQVINTAALKASADRGVTAATILDACMRNHFRNHPEMLAAWIHARRIERAPRRASREKESTTVAATHRQPDPTITRETTSLRQNSPALSDRDPLGLYNVTLRDDP
jgi:hypothetical protein